MKSQMVWALPVLLLLACGLIGCGGEPEPVVEKPKPTMEKAVAAQKECSQRLGSPVEITNSIGMKLALIPAGEFLMGSAKPPQEIVRMFELDESRVKSFAGEHPQRKIRITKPFYLDVYEVTQAEYEKVMGENRSWFSTEGGRGSRVGKRNIGLPNGDGELGRRDRVLQETIGQGREDVSPADRGGVGIRLSCWNDNEVVLWL